MRYLVIALMIVLLPLRGWAGNAMAVDMATQQVLMMQDSAASTAAKLAASSMPADCQMHDQAVDDKTDQVSRASAHCHSCDTCQLCLALASWTHPDWRAAANGRPGTPLLAASGFRSADTAASFKPPIS